VSPLNSPEPVIVVEDLVKTYGGRRAVDGLTFAVQPSELLALLGPNGAGKTTTVEILEGYGYPDGGRVRVLGLDPRRNGRRLKPRVGLMLQQGGVYPSAYPLEVLRLFATFFADPIDPLDLLHQVGLRDARRTQFRRLSAGQKQRLLLALALVGRPEVLFLDEPTLAMDPQARRATWELIVSLKEQGVTILLTTHFMDEAERLADRVAIIDHGRLLALDSPRALIENGVGSQESGVGASAIGLQFNSRPGLDLAALMECIGGAEVREESPGSYLASVEPGPAEIARLAIWLSEQDALLAHLEVGNRRRNLEDVFLQLTGRGLRD
jgi:ABC-2 type transport system ATP-binding protein